MRSMLSIVAAAALMSGLGTGCSSPTSDEGSDLLATDEVFSPDQKSCDNPAYYNAVSFALEDLATRFPQLTSFAVSNSANIHFVSQAAGHITTDEAGFPECSVVIGYSSPSVMQSVAEAIIARQQQFLWDGWDNPNVWYLRYPTGNGGYRRAFIRIDGVEIGTIVAE